GAASIMTSPSSARRTASARRRSAPSVSSGHCGWTTTRRSARCEQRRSSSRASSRTSTTRASVDVSTTERDYYEVLGVSRNASEAEIKRAFRARARELHPDVSAAPDADGLFREVAEAYEVLADPERRATYDRFGHAGLRRGGYHPTFTDFGSIADVFAAFFGDDPFGMTAAGARQPTRGGDVQAVVELELDEAFTGVTRSFP